MPYSICDHLKWAKCNKSKNLDGLNPRKEEEKIDRVGKVCPYLRDINKMPTCPQYSGYEYQIRDRNMHEFTVHIPDQTIVIEAASANSAINKARKLIRGEAFPKSIKRRGEIG